MRYPQPGRWSGSGLRAHDQPSWGMNACGQTASVTSTGIDGQTDLGVLDQADGPEHHFGPQQYASAGPIKFISSNPCARPVISTDFNRIFA